MGDFVANRPPQAPRADFVHSMSGGRSIRPAGLSQLGYACFWENGGGKIGLAEPVSASSEQLDIVSAAGSGGGVDDARSSSRSEDLNNAENFGRAGSSTEFSLLPFLDL